MSENKQLEAVRASLKRVQDFDALTLPRVDKLGESFNFSEAVLPAERLIGLFKQFPIEFLEDLPTRRADQLKVDADAAYSYLDQILKFDPKVGDAYNVRTGLIANLRAHYDNVFDNLSSAVSYGASRLRDFSKLHSDARAEIQAAKDEAHNVAVELKERQQEADRILEDVRKVAFEHGVSQQSFYFKEESNAHDKSADHWRNQTIMLSLGLGGFAVLSIFIHKIPLLTPSNNYEAVQLGVSKVLVFLVIGFMLVLASRNFLAHKHNSIVNKHRSNALLTFRALVDAAGSEDRRDVVLTHAAACIFSPQETGYAKGAERTEIVPSIVQAIPKLGGGP